MLSALLLGSLFVIPAAEPKPDTVLFDFETADAAMAWANFGGKTKEPAVKIAVSDTNATSGKQSLKLTFAGGTWPTVATKDVPKDWAKFHNFQADVTVERTCVVGFTVMQEKSQRGQGWDAGVSRWTKTAFLNKGKNTIMGSLHKDEYSLHPRFGDIVSLEIFMYQPHEGESIFIDSIRVNDRRLEVRPERTKFPVLGTDLVVESVQELGKKLEKQWVKPTERTLAEIEDEFTTEFDKLRKTHPKAIKVVLRDGEKGFDTSNPDKAYSGWKDAYWSSHGPDGLTLDRAENLGRRETHEIFMRHRSPLMRIDFSSIPNGTNILHAKLVVQRESKQYSKDNDPFARPTMWVAEPCNRPWDEYEVNAYQYAKDKYWKEIGGRHYGPDLDFLPIYIAHGQGQGMINAWDFTHAVRYWTDGKHKNHGFMLHGDSRDWLGRAWSREAKEIRNRPALYLVYVPK